MLPLLFNRFFINPQYRHLMKKNLLALIFILLMITHFAYAQDNSKTCKVLTVNLSGSYKGDCKNGVAEGEGEAIGLQRYRGSFKDGKPNGAGVYYYDDSTFHAGFFLDGQKEGKGESHYIRAGKPDSVVKGYWSGNVFRGKKYTTYAFNGGTFFDRYEINASPQSGRTISFEISTTSGSPTGVPSDLQGKPGYVLRLEDLTSGNSAIIRLLSVVETPTKFHVTYDIDRFPAILYGTMSNGNNFRLDLYKPATWNVKLYLNK